MANINVQKITWIHHWNDSYFSFKCTRDNSFRFENGQFVMLGLTVEDKPLLRAYSIASANWEEELEFFSIKINNGKLTSKLQHLKIGDVILVGTKPTGTLVIADLIHGKNLYLFATGTGIAPFLGLTKDFEVYEKFEKVILVHGVRFKGDLVYYNRLSQELFIDDIFGSLVKDKLIYYPIVSREEYIHHGRMTNLIISGKLFQDIGMPTINYNNDRVMICGSQNMLQDMSQILNNLGFQISPKRGVMGMYVIERAFVDR